MPDPLVIDPGTLRNTVTIQTQTATTDSSGTVMAWTPILTTRAAIVPMRGTDLVRSGQDTSQLYVTITIRWQPGITSAMRVTSGHSTYVIQAVENVLERNRRLNLLCVGLGSNND